MAVTISTGLKEAAQTLKNIQTEASIRKRTLEKMAEDEKRIAQLRQKIANLEKEIQSLEAKRLNRQKFLDQKKKSSE